MDFDNVKGVVLHDFPNDLSAWEFIENTMQQETHPKFMWVKGVEHGQEA